MNNKQGLVQNCKDDFDNSIEQCLKRLLERSYLDRYSYLVDNQPMHHVIQFVDFLHVIAIPLSNYNTK